MAASILPPHLCRRLFSVMELNGQNLKHIPPSDIKTRLTHRSAQCVLGPFLPSLDYCGGWVETEFRGE